MAEVWLQNAWRFNVFLAPELPIEHAVVDRFVQVFLADLVAPFHVGDRTGYPQYFVVGTSREAQFLDAYFHESSAGTTQFA